MIAVLCDECSFFTRKLTDGVTFCLQQGSPSQVESDEEHHAADKRLLAEYDDDPVKAEQEYGVDADFIQELREHVAEVESAVR